MKIKLLHKITLTLLALLMVCPPALSQEPINDGNEAFEQEFRAMMKQLNAVGISVAVVRDNEIVYTGAFGYKNLEKKEPMTTDALFRVASISKTFTATALMMLQDERLIDISDDASLAFPFKIRNPRYPDTPVTLEMIMSHISSINDSQGAGKFDAINPDVKGSGVSACYNAYRPGTGYQYSNYGFNILGAVIDLATGRPWIEYVEDNILTPLEIDGGYDVAKLDRTRLATLYSWSGGRYTANPNAYARPSALDNYRLVTDAIRLSPCSGLKISAPDLAKFMLMLMNYGTNPLTDKEMLSEESARRMMTVITDNARAGRSHERAGLGLMLTSAYTPGVELYGHIGVAYGLRGAFHFDPEKKFGFVMLCNGTTSPAVTQRAMTLMYNHFIKNR